MAQVSVKMPEEFLMKVSRLNEKTDVIIPRVLKAGGEVVLEKLKTNLNSVIGRDTEYPSRSTGQLAQSLGLSPAKQDKGGNHNVKVGFSEPRRDGVSNAKIANIIEYGKSGQPPKPFLKPASRAVKKQCIEAMKAKLDEEIGKL